MSMKPYVDNISAMNTFNQWSAFMTTFQSHLVDIDTYKVFLVTYIIKISSVPNTFMLDRAFLEFVYFTFENNNLNEIKKNI